MPDTIVQTRTSAVAEPPRPRTVMLPESYNYIGVFLTFRCPYHCSYCINRFDHHDPRSAELSGREWVEFFNRLDTRGVPITMQGGEPGCHPDFVEIVARTIVRHPVDILTNLEFNLERFVDRVSPARMNRVAPYAPIRVSYHPEQFAFEDILRRVLFLQGKGFRVGLYGVLHPAHLAAVNHAAAVCADMGVDFRTKPFLGWHGDVLYGDYANDGVATPDGKMRLCECAPTELLVAPDGSIHRCHSFLYAGLRPLAHLRDPDLRLTGEHLACNRFGDCNPCDVKIKNDRFQQFGHVAARIRNVR